jgi:ribosomal-protein-alanine N-acetyltransferase
LIGVSGFSSASEDYDAELMYHLSKDFWGKGYASEAVNATIDYTKTHLFFKCIEASIDPAIMHRGEYLKNQLIGHKWSKDIQKARERSP